MNLYLFLFIDIPIYAAISDAVVNWKEPRLFSIGDIGDACPSVRYLMREESKRLERICKPVLDSKAKPIFQNKLKSWNVRYGPKSLRYLLRSA